MQNPGRLVRFTSGTPENTWDYFAEVSAAVEAIPASERAWPMYRDATMKLKPIPEGLTVAESWGDTERDEALEAYRRQTGDWPERLEELTPGLLPAIPYDRFDGGPIKYCLKNDQPVLYSIGVDRVDDGGEAPDDEHPCPDIWEPPSEVSRLRGESRYRGDWVLWPPMRR